MRLTEGSLRRTKRVYEPLGNWDSMIGEKRVLDVGIEVMGHTAIDLFFFCLSLITESACARFCGRGRRWKSPEENLNHLEGDSGMDLWYEKKATPPRRNTLDIRIATQRYDTFDYLAWRFRTHSLANVGNRFYSTIEIRLTIPGLPQGSESGSDHSKEELSNHYRHHPHPNKNNTRYMTWARSHFGTRWTEQMWHLCKDWVKYLFASPYKLLLKEPNIHHGPRTLTAPVF